jgi:hypothetical protein
MVKRKSQTNKNHLPMVGISKWKWQPIYARDINVGFRPKAGIFWFLENGVAKATTNKEQGGRVFLT